MILSDFTLCAAQRLFLWLNCVGRRKCQECLSPGYLARVQLTTYKCLIWAVIIMIKKYENFSSTYYLNKELFFLIFYHFLLYSPGLASKTYDFNLLRFFLPSEASNVICKCYLKTKYWMYSCTVVFSAKVHLHKSETNIAFRWLVGKFHVLFWLNGGKDQKKVLLLLSPLVSVNVPLCYLSTFIQEFTVRWWF